MSKELEIEFKTLLTKDEYIKLCEKFKDCKRNLQINYYFDTSRFTLKASDIGLRVRMLDKDKYIVTLKRKKGYVLQEINENINKETFDQFLSTGIVPVEEIQKDLEDVIKGQLLVNYMSLSTYRIGFPYKKDNLQLISVNMSIPLTMNLNMKQHHMKQENVNLLKLFVNLVLHIKKVNPRLNEHMMLCEKKYNYSSLF